MSAAAGVEASGAAHAIRHPEEGDTCVSVFKHRWIFTSLAAILLTLPAFAHHSGAMFDDDKSVILVGTVRSFQWTNPHCWIQVLVPGDSGPVEWSVEMGSPSLLFRAGWKPGTLQAGAKITVAIRPMRDGSNGGLFLSATDAGGKPIGAPGQTSVAQER